MLHCAILISKRGGGLVVLARQSARRNVHGREAKAVMETEGQYLEIVV